MSASAPAGTSAGQVSRAVNDVIPRTGNLTVQIGPPAGGPFDPIPVFNYNGKNSSLSGSEFGDGWTGTFRRKVELAVTEDDVHVTDDQGFEVAYTKVSGTTYTPVGPAVNALERTATGWTETQPDGFQFIYDKPASVGRLVTLKNYAGQTWTLTYDPTFTSLVRSVKNPFNKLVTFNYDGSQKIKSVEDNANRLTTFTVSSSQLVTMTTPELCQTQFIYAASKLQVRIDPGGARTTYSYDGSDRVETVQLPNGGVVTYTYDVGGSVTTVGFVNARAKISTLAYENGYLRSQRDPLDRVTSYTFADGRLLGVENPRGLITTYTYASLAANNTRPLQSVQLPTGAITTYLYSGTHVETIINPLSKRTTLAWDSSGHRIAVIDALDKRTTYAYTAEGLVQAVEDPLNRITTYGFNATGQVAAVVDAKNKRTTYAYSAAGQLQAIEDPLNRITTYVRDGINRVIAQIDAADKRTTYTYNTACELQSIEDALNHITTYLYTAAGQRQVMIAATPTTRTTYSYDLNGNRLGMVNPLGKIWTSVYDSADQLLAAIDPLLTRNTYSYDLAGNRLGTVNPLGHIWTSAYDGANRTIASVNPLDKRTTFNYDLAGQQISVQDALTRLTTTVYDDVGRVLATINALNFRTTFGYDAAGQQVVLINARDNRTTFQYDNLGLLEVEIDALLRRTSFVYDETRLLISRQDARGTRISYTYDLVGRLSTIVYQNDGRVTFTYDAVGNRLAMHDPTGRTTYTYDEVNRILSMRTPANKALTYTYDAAGQRVKMNDQNNMVFSYVYDDAGQMSYLINRFDQRTTWSYDAAGRVIDQLIANTAKITYAYDAADQVVVVANLKSDGSNISRFSYTYDDVGNRTKVAESSGDVTTWTYDEIYQLKSEHRTGGTAFRITHTFDAVGNRTTENDTGTSTAYNYDVANQLTTSMVGAAKTTYTYDAAGNLRSINTGSLTTYTWNDENRLTVYASGNSFTYNGDGKRVQVQDATSTTKFIWDLENIQAETDGSDVNKTIFTLQPLQYGNLISQQRNVGGATQEYFLFDALGSTTQLLNTSQTVIDSYVYEAFGAIRSSTGSTVNPFRWIGKLQYYYDVQTLEYYLRARQYNTSLARFLTIDPIARSFATLSHETWLRTANVSSGNRYRYTNNAPNNMIDPSGMIGHYAPTKPWKPTPCPACPPAKKREIVAKLKEIAAGVEVDAYINHCQKWVEAFERKLPPGFAVPPCVVEARVAAFRAYYGGHAAFYVKFCDCTHMYIDNGYLGGDDRTFQGGDVPIFHWRIQ